MGVSKYNSEGYYDPTAYEALAKITQEEKAARYRPLVYICSPYSGDTEGNTEKARRYSRFAADAGTIPIAPHLLFYRKKRSGSWRFLWIWCCWASVSSSGCSAARCPTGCAGRLERQSRKI